MSGLIRYGNANEKCIRSRFAPITNNEKFMVFVCHELQVVVFGYRRLNYNVIIFHLYPILAITKVTPSRSTYIYATVCRRRHDLLAGNWFLFFFKVVVPNRLGPTFYMHFSTVLIYTILHFSYLMGFVQVYSLDLPTNIFFIIE